MPSMFPGMYADPNDPNRRPRTPAGDPDTWPASLRWSYWLSVAAAIVMVLAGLVMLTENPQAASDANPEAGRDLIEAFRGNLRFVGIANIITGLLIAALAAQLRSGSRLSRRILLVVIALAVFLNVVAFAIQVGGLAMILIVILLALAAFLMFRPDANHYVAYKTDAEH